MTRLLPLIFVSWALGELFLLGELFERVGFSGVLSFILLTGLIGSAIARTEGIRAMQRWRVAVFEGLAPEEAVLDQMLRVAGGLLILLPGVLTDVAGVLLVIAPIRRLVARKIRARLTVKATQSWTHPAEEAPPAQKSFGTKREQEISDAELVEEPPARPPK